MSRYDAIVAGLGAAGAATAWQLAARGLRVLGLDRFRPPHDRGSSHGRSRIIRQAYFEGEIYVPWLLDAYERWRRLERAGGRDLLTLTGGLMMGPPEGAILAGSLASARAHGLDHELLDGADLRRRWGTAFALAEGEAALYEPQAGVLRPEAAIETMLGLAAQAGAELVFEQPLLGWEVTAEGGVRAWTAAGVYEADRLVLAAGPWLAALLPPESVALKVERAVAAWFRPGAAAAGTPIWIRQLPDGRELYGLPELEGGEGIKAAFHNGHQPADPENSDAPPEAQEVGAIAEALARHCPGLAGAPLQAQTCRYTRTPDGHFRIGRLPGSPQVIAVSACSGHGFKFAPSLGAAAADLAMGERVGLPMAGFGWVAGER